MILIGNCKKRLQKLPDNSVDSIVTDPPYGLSFMGKKWDYDVPSTEIWKECLRVLKPGGHLLAFGGTRTYHRLVVNIEDAGFEIRDQIMWIYGSGFPKSMDISKAIDKAAGAEREVIGQKLVGNAKSGNRSWAENHKNGTSGGTHLADVTAPATEAAKQWSGWGTALKPANEPICLARKPFKGTVADNVLKHGTGGLNIDACRIGVSENDPNHRKPSVPFTGRYFDVADGRSNGRPTENLNPIGRWPANVIFDEEAAAVLDAQSGTLTSGANPKSRSSSKFKNTYGEFQGQVECLAPRGADSGGASRFFYVAKASKRDRGAENTHPTVKPIKLMQYLVRLVTPPGGTVLDPFMGSGTTGVACKKEGMKFVGCELNKDYAEIAKRRIRSVSKATA